MLYPKEDKISNTLMFACRTCQFSEPATSACIFRNELTNTVGETAGITQDVGSDPTVRDGLVITVVSGDSDLDCLPRCTNCQKEIFCEECGETDAGLWLEVFAVQEVVVDNKTTKRNWRWFSVFALMATDIKAYASSKFTHSNRKKLSKASGWEVVRGPCSDRK